jgi:hypothetical protein
LLALILYLTGYPLDLISFAGFFLFFVILCLIHFRKPIAFSYSSLLVFVFLFSVFSVYFIAKNTATKETNNMKALAENLATERDPVAEYLFERLTTLKDSLGPPIFSIFTTAKKRSLTNCRTIISMVLGQYLLRFTDCKTADSLILSGPDSWKTVPVGFFDAMIQRKAQLSGITLFHTPQWQINYLGR